MSSSEILAGAAVASFLLSLATVVYTIVSTRSRATAERVDKIDKALTEKIEHGTRWIDKLQDRVVKLESDIAHLPEKDSIHKLEVMLQKIEGKVGVLGERMEPLAAISNRLQEFLLEQAEQRR